MANERSAIIKIGDKEYECCCGNYSGCYETEIIEIAEEIEFQTK